MPLGTHVARDDKEIANLFAMHFGSVFSDDTDVDDAALDFDAPPIPAEADETCEPFSVADVLRALHNLDAGKGPGPDDIPPSFYKLTATAIAEPLTTIFNKSLSTGTVEGSPRGGSTQISFKIKS